MHTGEVSTQNYKTNHYVSHSATIHIIHILFLTVKYVYYTYEKMALQYVKIRLTQFIIHKHV